MSDASSPPFFQISLDNHSPWVVVTSVAFVVYSVMAVAAKIISRLHVTAMKEYDWVIVVSTVFALVQTVCIVAASKNGLGQHRSALPASTEDLFFKYTYAASILSILSLFCAKISVVLLIMAISPAAGIHQACYVLMGLTASWMISAVFALAFQCHLPSPWTVVSNQCIDRYGLQLYIGIGNIVTDLLLIALPAILMKDIKTNVTRKRQIISLFASRIIVPAFTITQLVVYRDFYNSDDVTWAIVTPTIWTQLMMNFSILTACVPSLKRVLDMFRSGTSLFTVPAQYETTLRTYGSSDRRIGARIAQSFGLRSQRKIPTDDHDTKASAGEWPTRQMKKVTGQHSNEISSSGRNMSNIQKKPHRSESQSNLTENDIMKTVDFEVGYEDTRPQFTPNTDHQSRCSTDPEDHDFPPK